MRERIGAYRVLVGKSEGRSILERPRHTWEGNIKNGSSRSGMGHGVDRSGSGNFLSSLGHFSFS
jgi:hypothetical protein